MQIYTDPSRESEPHALPNAEVFYWPDAVTVEDRHCDASVYPSLGDAELDKLALPITIDDAGGWYWWACFPGCMPDGDPMGPFESEADAIADAQDTD